MKKWLLLLLAAIPLTIVLVACNCGDKEDDFFKTPGGNDNGNDDNSSDNLNDDKPLTAGMMSLGAASSTESAADEQYTGEWVYLTASGSKYHSPDCQHVEGKDNLRRMTRQEANAQGFEPCKTCEPGQQ